MNSMRLPAPTTAPTPSPHHPYVSDVELKSAKSRAHDK